MSMKTIRVLQGHSICYRGEWYNQGAILTVPADTEFLTNRPKYDSQGKLLGQETVSQVEEIDPAEDHLPAVNAAPEEKKEEE